ncbi:MAG: lipoyl protein ligase domain-containing protein [Candidatus Thorarchaeota archaeon]
MEEWRLLDTGILSGAQNMALDDTILESLAQGYSPSTLRFLQFNPATTLVGFHQSVEHEIRIDYCQRNGVDINRRITGGGAILFTPTCLGWEIFTNNSTTALTGIKGNLYDTAQLICSGTIAGLRNLGVSAEFRGKNDIEVDGRKISGTGGTNRGSSLMYQGTLLIDFDVELMLKALRIPVEKLQDKEIDSVKDRVTCLKWELGYVPRLGDIKKALVEGFEEVLGIGFTTSGLVPNEEEMYKNRLPNFESKEWIYSVRRPLGEAGQVTAVRKTPGGLVRVSLAIDTVGKFIVSSFITGDFQVFPQRAIMDLEAYLKNASTEEESIRKIVLRFFEETNTQIYGVSPEDIIQLILEALKKTSFQRYGISLEESNHLMTVNFMPDELENQTFDFILLPYCAKLVDCEYRKHEGCTTCGDCTIGDIYELGDELGIPVRTVHNYEHLIDIIDEFKKKGTGGYIGSCCEGFYCKHHADFVDTKVPALLVDVDDSTCYELGEEQEAYVGKFEGQTHLKNELLRRIIKELWKRGRIRSEVAPHPNL